jgi:hypothetical protein
MKVGVLWFDDHPQRAIEERVERATQRYRERFGQAANTCYVNPVSLNGNGDLPAEFLCGQVKVIVTPQALPHHFWLASADHSQEEKSN